jgi:hypothetical protein
MEEEDVAEEGVDAPAADTIDLRDHMTRIALDLSRAESRHNANRSLP